MEQSKNPPTTPPKDTDKPVKCTSCGRRDDLADPKPWKCSHCRHGFKDEEGLKSHHRRTKCRYPHNRKPEPVKERKVKDRVFQCPRCAQNFSSKWSGDRHMINHCWKSCDECNEEGMNDTCSLQRPNNTAQKCSRCDGLGMSCHAHTGPIDGELIIYERGTEHTGIAATEQIESQRPSITESGRVEQCQSRRNPQEHQQTGDQEEEDRRVPLTGLLGQAALDSPGVPGHKPYSGLPWPPQGIIYDLPDVVPRMPSSVLEDGELIEICLTCENAIMNESIVLKRSDPFGPHLQRFCSTYNHNFRHDWVFVWFTTDPRPEDMENLRGTVIRWLHTANSFGPPQFPTMSDYEYFYAFNASDPRVRDQLRGTDQEQRDINAYYGRHE